MISIKLWKVHFHWYRRYRPDRSTSTKLVTVAGSWIHVLPDQCAALPSERADGRCVPVVVCAGCFWRRRGPCGHGTFKLVLRLLLAASPPIISAVAATTSQRQIQRGYEVPIWRVLVAYLVQIAPKRESTRTLVHASSSQNCRSSSERCATSRGNHNALL